MEFKDYPRLSEDVLTLTTDERIDGFQSGHAIFLHSYQDEWLAVQGDLRVRVHCSPADHLLFSNLVLRDQVRWLLTTTKKQKLLVQYCAPVEVSPLQLELGVDELIAEDLYGKHEIPDRSIESACRWLGDHFLVQGLAEGDWLTITRFSSNSSKGSFQILGKGWRADIEKSSDDALLIKRIAPLPRQETTFSLLIGQFAFRDASIAALLNSASQKALLDSALRDSASYLELWNLYNTKEWQRSLQQAEKLRSLQFVAHEGIEDGRENAWRLIPKSKDDYKAFRERWRDLELSADTQVDLGSERPDWSEELTTSEENTAARSPRGTIRFHNEYVIFKPASNRRDIRPRQDDAWLYLSVAGSRTIVQRRLTAKDSIDSGRRLPQLKWLLEGVAIPAPRQRTIDGLTDYARATFKGGTPTDKQALALHTALNTPDLAIIIGPPGTGKTQVIAALQRRLAEEIQDRSMASQVLISSFQHDAVDNALERSDVFGLPGTRVGGKRGARAEETLLDPWVDQQSEYLTKKIDQEYRNHPELESVRALSSMLALARVASSTIDQQVEAFIDISSELNKLDAAGLILPPKLESDLEDYIEELKKQEQGSAKHQPNMLILLKRIRGLRITSEAFEDDGPDRAWDLLNWLTRQNLDSSTELVSLLQKATKADELPDTSLQALADWQVRLLDQFLPDYRPADLKEQADPIGMALLDEIDMHLERKLRECKQGVAWVLEQLNDSLKIDRIASQEVIDAYSMVVGATCQQAAGEKMANLKAVAGLDSSAIEFDTVVIDEAARANPLDLFVPMAMAKRRIVLVGDDRQLPHMLEPDIEGQLQEEHLLTELQLVAFRSSLFERLRVKLQDLERQDTIRRVVMLDTQFRMHPVLGDFISQHFYETVNLGKVHPGRKPEDFVFDERFLSALGLFEQHYRNNVCQWIDVPAASGKEQRKGTSRTRDAEALCIAEEVSRLVQAGGDSLSVGVITFYAAQRDLIMEKLSEIKIDGTPLMELQNGSLELNDCFKWARKIRADGTFSKEERLRVGTVDAFQGKEFDVVLLSCVRTYQPTKPRLEAETSASDREKRLNHQFGFLRLANRMNVAMSRQRQMLICVGDAALATNSDAAEAVPALKAFHNMCEGEYGCIR